MRSNLRAFIEDTIANGDFEVPRDGPLFAMHNREREGEGGCITRTQRNFMGMSADITNQKIVVNRYPDSSRRRKRNGSIGMNVRWDEICSTF